MKRLVFKSLKNWKKNTKRKPLLLRGARQVGKTYVVRELGRLFDSYVELNFELMPALRKVFHKDLDPIRIVMELELITEQKIIPGKTLLFLDEIQVVPEAVLALRYFYEKMPELHVIAAGSLLDFALEHVGLPVGRVNCLYVYPMSFIEFLSATDNELLVAEIFNHQVSEPIAELVHDKLLALLGMYMSVGGMPEAIQCWLDSHDIMACSSVHKQLINAHRQDFQKYANKYQVKYVDLLFDKIPIFLSQPFKFSKISSEYRKRELAPCMELLVKAGIVHQVLHSSGHGVPIGAEVNLDKFKVIMLDVALSQAILGIDAKDWILNPREKLINSGAVAEAFVGQELLAYSSCEIEQHLYYWQRDVHASSAEVDYLIQKDSKVVPIEVKSAFGGRLRSLQLFLSSHPQSPYSVRFSAHNYSVYDNIRSYPLYAIAGFVGSSCGI